ncbi:CHAT domain-containing protein [Micromonospora tulbaghiae]|uniref:CHAT domain-containing protein n=1 Tax=Micromonospora tulbaghiae TaxID=479978 RepID=UPI003693FCA2
MRYLELYEIGLDSADLEAAIEDLTFATEHDGDHPDRAFWWYCRAIAHAYRIDGGSPDDLPAAIEWCERAFADAVGIDRGPLAVFLAELYWARYVEHREEPDAAQHLDALIDAVAAVQLDDVEPLVTANLRMMLGAGHAERHQLSGRRPDLDAAIALLAPSVDELPADVAEVAAGALLLCWAYHARGREDGDPGDADLAITLAARTAARLDPATEPRVVNLRWAQYLFLSERLERDDNHLDRDEAIRCLRHAAEFSPKPDPNLAMALAELLGDRGELYQDADDLASAAAWAGIAANAETDPADGWYPRLWQANAYLARWVQLEDVDDLARVADAMTWAIDAGLPDADLRLIAHRDRLKARYDLDKRRVAAGEVGEQEAAASRVPLVVAADEILRDEPHGDGEIRSDVAAVVLTHQMMLAADDLLSPGVSRLRELLALARGHPPDAHRAQLLTIIDGAIGAYEADGGAGDFGLTSLAEAMAMPEFDTSTTGHLRQMMSVAKLLRGLRTGDIRDLDSAVSGLYRARRDTAENHTLGRQLELFQTLASMTRTGIDSDRLQTDMERAVALLPAGDAANPLERLLGAALSLPRMLREGAGTAEINAFVDSLPSSAALSGGLFGYHLTQVVRMMAAAASVTAAYNHGTPAERADAGRAFVQAVDAVSASQSIGGTMLITAVNLAFDLLDRHPDPMIGEAAQRWAAESVARCRHPSDQSWAPAWFNLARLQRRPGGRDDLARGRAHALSALRGRTWQIVLQYDADYGLEAARRRADDVRLAAQWCRADAEAAAPADRQPILAELVQALDAGRGMVLGVAAAAGAVHDALVARGEPALAAQWLAGERFDHPDPQFDVADLRHRVVATLAQDAGAFDEAELFTAVTIEEIRAALAASDRDALVYLVASKSVEPGYAVVVTSGGRIDLIALPALRLDDSPLDWYLHTYRAVQVLTGGDVEAWRWSLSQLSSWAWQAGMGPLVDHCRGLTPDRPPRLVLVPIGTLSVVPWHAAWRLVDGAERRYAVQDAAISYAASARTWCDSTGRLPLAADEAENVALGRTGPALIIADPTGDLPSAADEADGIRRSFYPDATYLGRPASAAVGAGTPGEVLAWLAAPAAPPAAVLHAACHGIIEPDRPTQSHLRLAGGPLRADDLIRLAAAHRRIGTVVLAACTTNVAGEEYDEALTLSTAFLVAGAASVVGSLWAVPSASTGLLMYMLHHFLREAPGDPGEALRRAQLWMIDPGRSVPDGAAGLLRQVKPDRLAEPYRWAGFAHLGR